MSVLVNPFRFASGATPASNLVAAVGGFNAPSSSVTGTTVSVTGLSFQPSFVILWMVGRTEGSDSAALGRLTSELSFGMFNATQQYTWGCSEIDANANSNASGVHRNDCCIMRTGFPIGGQQNYRGLNFSSFNADGFTLAINTNNTRAWAGDRIQYLALGGSDLSSTKIGAQTVTSGTGSESYTPLAFQPKALLTAKLAVAINNSITAVAYTPQLGAGTGSGQTWTWGGAQNGNNAATMDTFRYFRSDETTVDMSGSGTAGSRARLTSLDATGWTFNRLEGAGNYDINYGALGGAINAKAGTFTANSAGASVTGLGFTPTAILFVTHGTTESTADTLQSDHIYSIGASVTGITQRCMTCHDEDNTANAEVTTGHRDDSAVMTSDTSSALDSRIAISSHDSDGFTYTMPTSTNNGYIVGYLALG